METPRQDSAFYADSSKARAPAPPSARFQVRVVLAPARWWDSSVRQTLIGSPAAPRRLPSPWWESPPSAAVE